MIPGSLVVSAGSIRCGSCSRLHNNYYEKSKSFQGEMAVSANVFSSFSATSKKDHESQNRTNSREGIEAGRQEFQEHP
ncbi:hypothetical protein A6X21_16650 [Planctopirus hydrillae]|uniref:Uncharacterized protein n=1 Tax=Planctopirus hydrillae TaxID=1841610 RepID=A0A1C3EQD0_9PLAN|nr:hypothetical protein A6X21_16650 [Planctopirus hydrillae]